MSTLIHLDGSEVLDVLDRKGWVKGQWQSVNGKVCLHGAIRLCNLRKGDAGVIQAVATRQGWGLGFNDADETTELMVRLRMVAGIDITDRGLDDTFGPQWRAVLSFLRSFAALTKEELLALPDPPEGTITRNSMIGDLSTDPEFHRDRQLAALAEAFGAIIDTHLVPLCPGASATQVWQFYRCASAIVLYDLLPRTLRDRAIQPWVDIIGTAPPEVWDHCPLPQGAEPAARPRERAAYIDALMREPELVLV